MFGSTWSHNLIRKYVVVFGTLFNNMYITRENSSGEVVQTLKIPLTFAPKEKMLARLSADPNLERPIAISLPHMSFEIVNYQYDSNRKLNTVGKIFKDGSYVYQPVPYDIIFNLYVMVKNAQDGTKIVEQILPYFTPEFTVTANILPEIGKSMDIPIVLLDTSVQDTYEGDFETRRALIWTMTFAMKGYLYGPVKSSKLIRFANTGFTIVPDLSNIDRTIDRVATITSQPGQLANGEPTANIELTVAYGDVDANSEYYFINQFSENL